MVVILTPALALCQEQRSALRLGNLSRAYIFTAGQRIVVRKIPPFRLMRIVLFWQKAGLVTTSFLFLIAVLRVIQGSLALRSMTRWLTAPFKRYVIESLALPRNKQQVGSNACCKSLMPVLQSVAEALKEGEFCSKVPHSTPFVCTAPPDVSLSNPSKTPTSLFGDKSFSRLFLVMAV